MLLRNSISSTKKFFNKTFQSFKSLLTGSGGGSIGHYQKLPKSSAATYNNFYGRVVAAEDHLKTNKKIMEKEPTMMKDQEIYNEGFKKFTKQIIISPIQNRGLNDNHHDDDDDEIFERKREFVKEKLKEMVLMDLINVENVKDIEEVLYYYSHITCPVYVEIVNKFFMEMYSEFFIHQQTYVTNSRRI